MRVLGLFSGIGGFELGLQRAGATIVGMCECDPFCRSVLSHHWPGVPVFDDVRSLTASDVSDRCGPVDLICGGFPCQDISCAGRGAGLAGDRSGLWFEMLRLIGEIRPAWVVAENVAALRRRGLGEVLRGLASIGYDAEWHSIPAAAVGAPHRRDRVWVIAHPMRPRLEGLWRDYRLLYRSNVEEAARTGRWASEPNVGRVAHGVPHRVDRLRALGNAIVPQIAEIIGRRLMEEADA